MSAYCEFCGLALAAAANALARSGTNCRTNGSVPASIHSCQSNCSCVALIRWHFVSPSSTMPPYSTVCAPSSSRSAGLSERIPAITLPALPEPTAPRMIGFSNIAVNVGGASSTA